MKRIGIILLVVILVTNMTICVSADNNAENMYQIDNVTVMFDENSQFSVEQQEQIVNLLVNPEQGVARANLICNIFGHKNTSEPVVAITHKVLAESPRCLQENFIITKCSRCDETTVERVSYAYISCCPEE